MPEQPESPSPPPPEPEDLARLLAQAALDRKATRVVALDVHALTSFASAFVLASGGSERQVRAIADAVRETARASGGRVLGEEGHEEGRWVLVDLGDVVVHVFREDMREHFDLDRLWSDAAPIALGEDAASAGRGGGGA